MPLIFTPPFNFAASIVKVNGVSLCSITSTGNQGERRYWWEWGTRVLFKGLVTLFHNFVSFFHFFLLFIILLECDVQAQQSIHLNNTRTTPAASTGGHAMPLIFTLPFNFAASIVKVNGVSLCSITSTGNQRERRYWWEWGTRVLFKGFVTLVPIFVSFFHFFPLFIIVLEYGVRGQNSIHLNNIRTLPANSTHARGRSIRRS
ncbi:hypothetical protein B0O80DRAFT_128955 [Mortierella sp. GBAus27b]|nr:hypothetical protein B0O80DRAFT_128955 [Mortierella sp. GBAus27b]